MNHEVGRIRWRVAACGLALVLLSAPVRALVIVNQAWLRPAQTGQSAELYMNLTSTDGATLVAVHCDDAANVVFRGPDKLPRALATLLLPAKTTVALAPGKTHFALIRLNRPVNLGDHVPLTLTVLGNNGSHQEIKVIAEVRIRSAVEEEMRAHPPPAR